MLLPLFFSFGNIQHMMVPGLASTLPSYVLFDIFPVLEIQMTCHLVFVLKISGIILIVFF
jgi:hypothetical protein